jgi:hypothetical protein
VAIFVLILFSSWIMILLESWESSVTPRLHDSRQQHHVREGISFDDALPDGVGRPGGPREQCASVSSLGRHRAHAAGRRA